MRRKKSSQKALTRDEKKAIYDAEHTKRVFMKLNKRTDADILSKLEEVDSKQGYIKKCIRYVMAHKIDV